MRRGRRGFGNAGNPCSTKIDDLCRSGLIDHDIIGPDVLVQHLLAMKGTQAPGDLLDYFAYRFQIRFRIVDHPLGEGLSIDAVSYTHLRAHETPEHLVCR